MTRPFLLLLLLFAALAACEPAPAIPEVVPTDTPSAPAPTPTATATPTPTPTPEWAFHHLAADGSTVVIELRVFAGIDVRVTLDGRPPDEVSVTGNILRHLFEGVAPGKRSVTASDVMGFSDSREIVVDPPPGTPAPTSAPEPTPTSPAQTGAETWRGLVVSPEHRCSPYDSDDYRYSQSVEPRIVADMGGIIYGPYTGTWFDSTTQTDIEHIVARSEAHDSGLCAVDAATKRRF
ncbi:MAG: hypothetical protein OXE50_08035, partial [Chloroflexi bacterium]|nr:hypothetical protein [Chloroflexota bacterium]